MPPFAALRSLATHPDRAKRALVGLAATAWGFAIPSILAANTGRESLLRARGEAFVEALKASDSAALEAFARLHLASSVARDGKSGAFASRMRQEAERGGRIVQHSIRVLPQGRAVFVFCKWERGGAWLNYQFVALPEDGDRLQMVFVATALEPMERPAVALGTPEATAWLARFRETLDRQHPFSGVIVVRQRGRDAFTLASGLSDTTTATQITRETRFGMASGSKLFTAVAVLQLAQAGKLSLDDTLAQHLPQFPNQAFARATTLHQLLTHTAGAGNYWNDAYEAAWNSITELDQMIPFVLPHLGSSPAGTFTYSNSGYILLGLVVESISGQTFREFARTRIFEPAGMTSTGYPLRSEAGPQTALPYDPETEAGATKLGVFRPVELGTRGTSAGGAMTTADDMLRFVAALRDGRLLNAANAALLHQHHASMGSAGQGYGYGAILENGAGGLAWGHGGHAPGTYFEFKIYPELDAVMVVLSNYNTIGGFEMAAALDALIRNGASENKR